jgi:tRNA(Ile)-lysidine synthase TilS/MesJ
MFKYPRNHDIDFELFSADRNLTARYGLPKEVRFCRKCVVSNQRPNTEIEHSFSGSERKKTINFDETGVCDACRQAGRKREIDWGAREQMLFELCDRFRRTDGGYDCLCPGSGGKDSVRAYNLLKNKYNMNPLMATFGQCIVTPVGRRNLERWS